MGFVKKTYFSCLKYWFRTALDYTLKVRSCMLIKIIIMHSTSCIISWNIFLWEEAASGSSRVKVCNYSDFFLIYQHYHHFSLCQWTHKAFNLRHGEFFSLICVVGKFTLHKVYSSNTDFRLHSREYQDNSSLNLLKHYFEKFSTTYYSKVFKTVLFQFTIMDIYNPRISFEQCVEKYEQKAQSFVSFFPFFS